jgi:hypothetical protein
MQANVLAHAALVCARVLIETSRVSSAHGHPHDPGTVQGRPRPRHFFDHSFVFVPTHVAPPTASQAPATESAQVHIADMYLHRLCGGCLGRWGWCYAGGDFRQYEF